MKQIGETVWLLIETRGSCRVVGETESTLLGWAYHEELDLLAEAGLTPMDVLRAATSDAARVLRWSERLGTVERGKIADMVVLDGDPLADVRHTKRVHAVFKGGIRYEAEALRRSTTTRPGP